MNLPDRVFAVGGAGKAIAFELLESEWVLREILQPRPSPYSMEVTIIDTAQDEENSDRQRIREIRKRINELESELRDAGEGRPGTVEVEYKLIVEDIQLESQYDLLGPDVVERITSGNGMDPEDWWLENRHINENLDFAKGVVRKRGLGKGIYYKSYAEDDEISTYIDLPEKGRVAIIAGLGGGTGSGILMDLARHLKEQQRTAEITLFGVLPNHTEGIKENTNAFAALSELEYLSLNEDELFKDIILSPIDPTGFDGKRGNRIQTSEVLEEFDEALIYLIAAYYNTQSLEDPFANKPQFAPFTIGIPQVLRYNVEAINEARGALRELLQTKEDALDAEETIYTEVERFLNDQYPEEIEGELRDLDKTDLEERLDEVESLLNFDLFEELEYESLSMFSDIIEDSRRDSDDVVDQIDIIAGSIRAVDTSNPERGFVDEIDEHLASILERSLRLIVNRKELLERQKAIDDSRIANSVQYLINAGDTTTNPGVQLQRLESQLADLEDKRERVTSKIEEEEQKLQEIRDEQEEEVERRVQEFDRATQEWFDQLQSLSVDAVKNDVDQLYDELERFRTAVVNAEDIGSVEQVSTQPVDDVLNRLDATLAEAGVQFDGQQRDIRESMQDLKQAHIAIMKLNQEEGTLESIAPWQSSTEEEREEAHKDYRMQKNELEQRGVFSIGPAGSDFTAEVTFSGQSIVDEIERQHDELVNNIVGELQASLQDEPHELIRELETTLENNPTREDALDVARRAIRQELGDTEEIESQLDELADERQELDRRLEVYEPAIELFQDLNNERDRYLQNLNSFQSQLADYDEGSDRSLGAEPEQYVYVKNIQPSDVFRATGTDDIAASGLFNSRDEEQRLRGEIEALADNARNQQYTGLLKRKFTKEGGRYSDMKVRTAFMSRAIDQLDPETLDVEDTFKNAFAIGGQRVESPYTSWTRDFGGPWDIGMSVFIDGVFLDNLRKVVRADGYYDGYKQRHAELDDDILIHHSNGLSDGYYVRRDELVNLESEEGTSFFIRDETDVVDDLLSDYVSTYDTGEGSTDEPALEEDG